MIFSRLTNKHRPDAPVSFVIQSSGNNHCDRLSSSKPPRQTAHDATLTGVGRRVELALIGKGGTQHPVLGNRKNKTKLHSWRNQEQINVGEYLPLPISEYLPLPISEYLPPPISEYFPPQISDIIFLPVSVAEHFWYICLSGRAIAD